MIEWDPFKVQVETESQRPLERTVIDGAEIRLGSHVRLRPLGRADVLDIALNGRAATVVKIEQDYEDQIHVCVTVDDDPGSDFGRDGKPGHRFFFRIDEVEPL